MGYISTCAPNSLAWTVHFQSETVTADAKLQGTLVPQSYLETNLGFKLVLDALRLCQLAAELLLVSRLQLQLGCQGGSTGLAAVQLPCMSHAEMSHAEIRQVRQQQLVVHG